MAAPAPWTDRDVRGALGLDVEQAGDTVFTGVSTDTRHVSEGDLFVALVGERFDGHDFVTDALARGARGAVVSRQIQGDPTGRLYPVDDTLVALGALAAYRRERLSARRVGITGSSGKTVTKNLLRGALEGTYRVHATAGNLNNRIGLPMTLLSASGDAEVLVLEMGTNEPGEIATLAAIARPEIGVLTTVGESHLEKLGSLEGVLDEKLDLLRGLEAGGVGVVGDEPPELPEAARRILPEAKVAGWSDRADEGLRPVDVGPDHWGRYHFRWRGETVTLQIPGRHMVQNALLALAVAELLDVGAEAAARGVGSVEPAPLRGEIRTVGRLTLLLDCYNANPQSIRASLELLADYTGTSPRVALLGTMLELGARSEALHQEVLEDALGRDLELVVATGAFARVADRVSAEGGAELLVAEDPGDAYERLRPRLGGNEVLLLKASRGVALEKLVPRIEADFGAGAPDEPERGEGRD